MAWSDVMFSPIRIARDLPIAAKLAMTVVGALSLLTGVSMFALDRLDFVAGTQENALAQLAVQHQVETGLLAAQDLRVVSRELQSQQTVGGVRAALERASRQVEQVKTLMLDVKTGDDQPLLDDSLAKLNSLADVVKKAGALRTDLLTARQKRLFQARPTFETAMGTLINELARGDALGGGVDSVRDAGQAAHVNQLDPVIEAAGRYRLALARVQSGAMMFMATGSGSAVNDIRDGTADAKASMTAILSGSMVEGIKADAQMVDAIGQGIASASADLVSMSRQLDQLTGTDIETASQDVRMAFQKLANAAADRGRAASASARAAAHRASDHIWLMVGAIAVLMIVLGGIVTRMLAGPIRRLTRIVQSIAAGQTDQAVPYTAWRDEIGRMAGSVETLRGVMRQTFIQAQMIEQLPVGVMTAEAGNDFRISYLNPEARIILESVQTALPVAVADLVGQPIDLFHPGSTRQRDLVADPRNLPHSARITIGSETLDLRITAVYDRGGAYAGPLLTWRKMTGQVQLVHQFEQSVGAIARTVAESADGMRDAARVMRQSAMTAGERTLAVSVASNQASHSVTTAAAGAEEVAVSVAEIARQVAESAQIASMAVAEAQATDASVSGLSQAATRISAVVRLISDIAGRTNLLALNATIEAARAGDAGKGFAVVAGEVKNLATQTAKATEEIGGQITAMQDATSQAVTALRSIGATIQRMNDIATVIAGSVEQQGAATTSIAQAVQHAAAGTAEVNTNIAAVSLVVEETGDRAGGVLEAATAMSGQAATLSAEVEKFLVAVQRAA